MMNEDETETTISSDSDEEHSTSRVSYASYSSLDEEHIASTSTLDESNRNKGNDRDQKIEQIEVNGRIGGGRFIDWLTELVKDVELASSGIEMDDLQQEHIAGNPLGNPFLGSVNNIFGGMSAPQIKIPPLKKFLLGIAAGVGADRVKDTIGSVGVNAANFVFQGGKS